MFARMLSASLSRRLRRKFAAVLAVWVGLGLVVALLALSLDVGDRMNRELSAFGANLELTATSAAVPVRVGGVELATPTDSAHLAEDDVPRLKSVFWRNNVVAFCPRLWTNAALGARRVEVLGVWFDRRVPVDGGEDVVTGARQTYRAWEVDGAWPAGETECLVGASLAAAIRVRAGDEIVVAAPRGATALRVVGTLKGDAREEAAVVAPLAVAQRLANLPGKVGEIDVAALTTPENKLAEKYRKDPRSLTPAEYERWGCTPYPGSVALDLAKAVPGSTARVVRRVAETQGAVLSRIEGLMSLLGVAVLVSCALGIVGIVASAVTERRTEAALHRAIGARRADALALFVAEAGVLGLVGGLLAAVTGVALGAWLVRAVFDAEATPHFALAIVAVVLGPLLTTCASLLPTLRTVNQSPARVLHGG